MNNEDLTVGEVKELKKRITDIWHKQELIIEAIRCKILNLDSEIAQDKMILIKNPDASDMFKRLKEQSMQSKQDLIREYKELLKEIEEDEKK